jgi:hypothetical protein
LSSSKFLKLLFHPCNDLSSANRGIIYDDPHDKVILFFVNDVHPFSIGSGVDQNVIQSVVSGLMREIILSERLQFFLQ